MVAVLLIKLLLLNIVAAAVGRFILIHIMSGSTANNMELSSENAKNF